MPSLLTEVDSATPARVTAPSYRFKILISYCIYFFLFFVVLAVFVPLNPEMPSHGLDPSWKFAMNEGVARNLVFGRDIVFTFGPYASIYTEVYEPQTDKLMLLGAYSWALVTFFSCRFWHEEKVSGDYWFMEYSWLVFWIHEMRCYFLIHLSCRS
jgi:hypothetical protein